VREGLDRLLFARSVAVIGASDQPGNLGATAIRLLRKFGFAGPILPVNPRRDSVAGLRCFPSVGALPEVPDLALITTAAPTVADVLRDCIAAGVRTGIAWAGGFAEAGEAGIALQAELTRLCDESGFLLAGPNCLGIVNAATGMAATFSSALVEAERLLPGTISMVSQSGGLSTMCHTLAQQAGFGFRLVISSGNEAVITLADYIRALVDDDGTRVIVVYLEGVRDGTEFCAALAAARAAGKPVVVLKGGLSEASAAAVAAHTGALAGEGRVWEAVLREHGAIQVHGLEDLLDAALFLASEGARARLAGAGIGIVTTGGGSGVVTADQCARAGLATPKPSAATLATLRELAPPLAALGNPFDLTPQVYTQAESLTRFGATLDAIAAEPALDVVYVQFGPMAQRGAEVSEELSRFRARSPKPVCVAWPLAPPGAVERLRAAGAHVFPEYGRVVALLAALARSRGGVAPVAVQGREAALPEGRDGQVISEHACHAILAAAGLPVPAGRLAVTAGEAAGIAQDIEFPVALKGISPQVTHRAAAGLLALGLRDAAEVATADARLRARAAESGVSLDGLYVQRMHRGGLEVLVSAFRDPVFGPVVSVGAGGALTEALDDVALARAPLDEAGAVALLGRLRLMRRAAGRRVAPLADFVARFSQLAAAAPWQRFVFEVNPVAWSEDGVVALDGLLLIERA
jgi:acyl-CoA synthetase (NDP forming)